jgi:NTP pyrophosphatase (non-canonical NTP hydrolase)
MNEPNRGDAPLTDATATVARLIALMRDFVAERAWEPFHDPKNLSASIAIEAAELMEHFQWLRSDQLHALRDDPAKMAAIRDELADVFAYLLSFAGRMDIDLSSALQSKMVKNALKYPAEHFHGRFGSA